jgi:DNA-binding NarL/FixJ family response regulator
MTIANGNNPSLASKSIAVCDTQPVTTEGIRTLLGSNSDLGFQESSDSPERAVELMKQHTPDVLLIDKAFGLQAILECLHDCRAASPDTGVVIWGVSMTEGEALRFLRAGARGILNKTASVAVVLACLRTVAEGRNWMEDAVLRSFSRSGRYPRSELTARERQVLDLVEQGFGNKEIAHRLGISSGTVKIHLQHIFEKTGVHDRYGLLDPGLKGRPRHVSAPEPRARTAAMRR